MPNYRGEAFRSLCLCVDSYDGGVWKGRFYYPALEGGGRRFGSLPQFLTAAEALFDDMRFPQSFTAKRSFSPLPEGGPGGAPGPEGRPKGRRGTFLIQLLFRQNASWQGSVTWVEGSGGQSFRSVLELILLIDSALGGCGEGSQA
ncbi:MAG: hypothetical protein HFF90_04915 [Oscillibacter sp.]|nr:hypothetical protein [Oscillibacter sp.]